MSQSTSISIFLWIYLFLIIFFIIFKSNLSIIQTIMILIKFTILISLIISNLSTWSIYSFLIFLIIIGGLIILFILFISLITNQLIFSINKKILLIYLIFFFFFISIKFFNSNYIEIHNILNQFNLINFLDLSLKNNNNKCIWININQLYNFPINLFIILIILFLLFILLIITKICLINIKPLRSTKK